jgi:hypothetical protein
VSGVCCVDTDCEPDGNDCVGNQCQCGDGATCGGSTPTCCGDPGSCTNTQTDPTHCGTCGNACSGATPVCFNGACVCGDVCANGCQFSTVQQAIDNAGSGDTIYICAGTYPRSGGAQVAAIGDKDLTLIGAGAGSGGTIFDGGHAATVVAVVSCEQSTCELQHLSVTGANGGPAIAIANLTVTLTDVTVTGNTISGNTGGAILNIGSALILNAGTTVTGNASLTANGGGGILTDGGSVTMNEGSHVTGNDATNGSGGGIYILEGAVTLNAGSHVTENTAAITGGGIYNNLGTVTVNPGSDLSDNEAPPGNPSDCVNANGGVGCP